MRLPAAVVVIRYLAAMVTDTITSRISHQNDLRKLLTAININVVKGRV